MFKPNTRDMSLTPPHGKAITITDLAVAFSIGRFDITYEHVAEDAVWEVIEAHTYHGKKAIIEQCKQVAHYFKSVTTDFKTHHVISEKNLVVVNGTAAFLRDGIRVSFVSACDLYEFNDTHKIQKITSYCIQSQ